MNLQTRTEHDRRLAAKLTRELGNHILTALEDPTVEDIARNSDGWLWVKKLSQPWIKLSQLGDVQTENILRAVASSIGVTITPDQPYLDGTLLIDGSRIHGNIPPETRRPSFTIRKFPSLIFSLPDYVDQGALSTEHNRILRQAIKDRKNIFVIGSTGSGKTTLVNAIIDTAVQYAPDDRFVVIEDTGEIRCAAENTEQLFTTHNRSLEQLVKETLRMRPDRIIIGEVRGSEALHLLEIWNTGHSGGIATAHADSATPRAALDRLEMLVARANAKLGNNFIRRLIGSTVNIIVCIQNTEKGREINSITHVTGYQDGEYQLLTI